jgi:DNA polymerase-3 subunit beta
MKIIINSYELKSALKKFKNLKYEFTDMPAQKSLFIITGNNYAIFKICTGNIDECYKTIQMEIALPANVIEPGNTLITNKLIPVIESIEAPEIIITSDEIKYGENLIQYASTNYDFITMHTSCENKLFEIPESELYRLIKNTSYCIAQDERRPIFTGLNFQKNKVCALDEFRLAICSTDKFYTDDSITLPGNLIKLLLKVLNKRSENTVQAYTDNESKYVKIVIGDLIITSKLLPGEFIRYSSIIPEECSLKIKADPKKLYEKMKAMFKMTLATKEIAIFTIEQDKLIIEKVNTISKIQESIPIEILENETELPFKIASNPAYWKEPLKKYKKCTIEFSSRVSPIILKNDADLDLILPIRLEE